MWSADGREIYFTPGPGRPLISVAVTTTGGFAFGLAPPMSRSFMGLAPSLQRPYDAARDGKRFLGLTTVEGLDPTVISELRVVLNWFEELRARATPRP
jgi:hypothetical protein